MEDLGRLLAGRYRLAALLGQGGMGAVWRAHDERLNREVAVKELRLPEMLGAGQRETWMARLDREARAAARLKHPGIITVHDRITGDDGRPWIVMELVHGRSLDDLLKAEGPLPAHQVAHLGLQILAALSAAHQAGITHRDIKPTNVLLEGDRVVLTDFGVAVIDGDPALTGPGVVLGTPAFMSPEQVNGLPATAESDLWSLGATLYTAVEGHPPFAGASTGAVFVAITTQAPPPAIHAGPLEPVLSALLRKDPAERPSIAQLHGMLTGLAAAPQAPPLPGAPKPSGRRYGLIAAAAVGTLVLLGGLGFAAVQLLSGSGGSGNASSSDLAAAGPLRTPMQLRPVMAWSPGPCKSGAFPSQDGHLCYALGSGFTVNSVKDIRMGQEGPQQGKTVPVLSVTLLPSDAQRFTSLTEHASTAYQENPNNPGREIAVVVDGQVVMAPQVTNGPITGGNFDIDTGSNQPSLQQLFHRLTGH